MNKRQYCLIVSSFSIVALVSGCNLAPAYVRPEQSVPESYPVKEEGSEKPVSLPQWKAFFKDGQMQRLIELALKNNRDLRVAMLNIEKTRAQYRIQRADLLPTVNVSTTGNLQRTPVELATSALGNGVTHQYAASLGFSAFELDLFGRIRNLTEQALESFYAVTEDAKTARLSLVAETAGIYLQWVADKEVMDLTEQTLLNRQKNLDLIITRFKAGVASDLDVSQAKTLVEEARTSLAEARTQVGQDENSLVLLLGCSLPDDLGDVRKLGDVAALADLPAGLPSSLLANRPDILAAEHTLKGTNANIGAARANFFPTISLTTDYGRMSAEYGNLFSGGGRAWSFLPSITLPVFDTGRNIARLDVSETDKKIAVAKYEKAVQSAFREVADALIYRQNVQEKLSAQLSLVEATRSSLRHAITRYGSGVSSYLNVLDAQRTLYTAQNNLIATRLKKEMNALTLYKVLGGGWM